MIREAGFEIFAVRDNDYRFTSARALSATWTYGVSSISVLATRN